MRRNIKEPPEFKTSNLDESIVSEETVNSGNYSDAQKILQNGDALPIKEPWASMKNQGKW